MLSLCQVVGTVSFRLLHGCSSTRQLHFRWHRSSVWTGESRSTSLGDSIGCLICGVVSYRDYDTPRRLGLALLLHGWLVRLRFCLGGTRVCQYHRTAAGPFNRQYRTPLFLELGDRRALPALVAARPGPAHVALVPDGLEARLWTPYLRDDHDLHARPGPADALRLGLFGCGTYLQGSSFDVRPDHRVHRGAPLRFPHHDYAHLGSIRDTGLHCRNLQAVGLPQASSGHILLRNYPGAIHFLNEPGDSRALSFISFRDMFPVPGNIREMPEHLHPEAASIMAAISTNTCTNIVPFRDWVRYRSREINSPIARL